MPHLRLIAIDADGRPSEETVLDAAALEVCQMSAGHYARTAFRPPWIGYLAVEGETPVGSCGFKTPACDGRVEIAYGTFREHEGRGVATEMARRLVRIAWACDPSLAIVAQTLPEENASCAILRKLGFAHTGTVDHPEDGPVWEWRLDPME